MRQHSIHFQLADFLVVSVLREDLWSETENEKTVCQGRMAGWGLDLPVPILALLRHV